MFNILPDKDKRIILKEYRLRVTTTALWFLFVTGVFSLVFLAPYYFIADQKEKEAFKNLQFFSEKAGSGNKESFLKIVKDTTVEINVLKKDSKDNTALIIGEIAKAKQKGVSINSFSVSDTKEKNKIRRVLKLSGKSQKRADLLSFAKTLEENPAIENVELPISNYAKESDISFSINAVLKI